MLGPSNPSQGQSEGVTVVREDARTPIGSYLYTRIMLLFRINPKALQARLPEPWVVASLGPEQWAGRNLAVGFCDVLRIQDAAGNLAPSSSNRYVPFNGPARNAATGEVVNMWYRAYALHPAALLGWSEAPQNPAVPAAFSTVHSMEGRGTETTVTERYEIMPETGGALELEIEYARGPLVPYHWHRNIRCPAVPSFGLHYSNDEMRDEVRSTPEQIDRVRRFRFRAEVPELADLFDGTEELIAITSVPWSEREVFRLG